MYFVFSVYAWKLLTEDAHRSRNKKTFFLQEKSLLFLFHIKLSSITKEVQRLLTHCCVTENILGPSEKKGESFAFVHWAGPTPVLLALQCQQ